MIAFFQWWLGELLGLMPRRLLRTLGVGRDRLSVVVTGEQARFTIDTASAARDLGIAELGRGGAGIATRAIDDILNDLDLARCDVLVMLDGERALKRAVSLPAAPGLDIRRALEREIERYTPFKAEQVYFFYTLDAEKTDDRAYAVEIAVAPRRFIDPMVDRLVTLGAERQAIRVGITGLDAVLPANGPMGGEETEALPAEPLSVPRGLALALLAIAVFGFTALAAPTIRLYLVRHDLAARASVAQNEGDQVKRLSGEVERLSAGLGVIANAKGEAPSVVRVLDRISALLPDDTFLDQFNVVGREIEIEGTTRTSSALVRVLESAPMFEKVTYVAPVTRDPVTGAERFHFSIQFNARKTPPAAAKP